MRVLGIDPGLTRCGVGVVDVEPNRTATLVDVVVLRSPADLDTPRRLARIADGLEAIVEEHRPHAVALERVFARSDVSTIMGTAQISGVAMLIAARRALPVALHTPSEVKAAITGYGNADKRQRRRSSRWRSPSTPTPCHASCLTASGCSPGSHVASPLLPPWR